MKVFTRDYRITGEYHPEWDAYFSGMKPCVLDIEATGLDRSRCKAVLIGLLMNFLASAVFVGVSTAFYIKKKTLQRAIIGLVAGSLSMTVIMLLWNYIVTPMYMGVPREAVLGMILPLLLPFNLLKASLNSAVVMALYKGVVTALRKSKLLPDDKSESKGEHKSKTIVIVSISAFLVVTLVLVVLIFAGIIKF